MQTNGTAKRPGIQSARAHTVVLTLQILGFSISGLFPNAPLATSVGEFDAYVVTMIADRKVQSKTRVIYRFRTTNSAQGELLKSYRVILPTTVTEMRSFHGICLTKRGQLLRPLVLDLLVWEIFLVFFL